MTDSTPNLAADAPPSTGADTSAAPAERKDLTPEEITDLIGDDIAYWMNNAFMDRAMLTEKVYWWINQAVHATRPPSRPGDHVPENAPDDTPEEKAPRRYCSRCDFYTDHVSTAHDGLEARGLLRPKDDRE